MNPNASLPALEGKVEQIVELCRQFHVKRLEIFGSAATGAFRPESSDLDFVVDFGDQPLGPWGDSLSISLMPSKYSLAGTLI
jgi:predicted nucleotidyltransferase